MEVALGSLSSFHSQDVNVPFAARDALPRCRSK
jgi:hypothetical protein